MVIARVRVRSNLFLAKQAKVAFIGGLSANGSEVSGSSATKHHFQTAITQENTVGRLLTERKKCQSSATNHRP